MSVGRGTADLSERLVASITGLGGARTAPGLYGALLRLLAFGQPVGLTRLAAAAELEVSDVERIIMGWTDTEYSQGQIVGYALTLQPTAHRFMVDGKQLYTWCALDTLFLPAVIGRVAQIESPCGSTGVPIRLTVEPARGVTNLDPLSAVISVPLPQGGTSVRASFCSASRFFINATVAQGWQAGHPGMEVLSVAEAYRVSRPLSEMLLKGTTHSSGAWP